MDTPAILTSIHTANFSASILVITNETGYVVNQLFKCHSNSFFYVMTQKY